MLILGQNAGANAGSPMEDLPLSKFQEVMNTNVSGTFLCTREAFKYFKSQDPQGGEAYHQTSFSSAHVAVLGRIINNASISAHTPRPHSIAYTASKHAVSGITKCANLDGRAFNISCTQLDIGESISVFLSLMSIPILPSQAMHARRWQGELRRGCCSRMARSSLSL